jgi:cysteine desulfurase
MSSTKIKPIYLDYAATTPMASEAVAAMVHCLTLEGEFANSASLQHGFGERAYQIVEQARFQMAGLLNCKINDLIFTSGATESNNLAIKGVALSYQKRGKHIVTSATEHKSVLDTCKYLESVGFKVSFLRPDAQGDIRLQDVLQVLTDETILVSLMHVNNETGVIQELATIANALQEREIAFHVDAAQSAGKLLIDLNKVPIDLLSLSAHKFYGAKGIGCLYVRNRKKTALAPLLHGGGQEFGLRPGTLPTHQIVAMATAFKIAHQQMAADFQHCQRLEQIFIAQLNQLDGVLFNGNQQHKLPNILNLSFENVSSDALIIALRDEIAIASGSACNTGAMEASHVLRAMGIEGDRLYGAVRISFGRYTTEAEIIRAGQRICEEVTRLRQLALE